MEIKYKNRGFYTKYSMPIYRLKGYEEWFQEHDLDTVRNPNSVRAASNRIITRGLNLGQLNSFGIIR